MTTELPQQIQKYVDQYRTRDQTTIIPSVQGFIVAEPAIRNDPDMRLLCAVVNNWATTQATDGPELYDCRTVLGRAQVASVVNACLTYLPSSNKEQIIKELVVWIAYRAAEAQIQEKFFSEKFLELIRHLLESGQAIPLDSRQNAQQQAVQRQTVYNSLKTSVNTIDMTVVPKQTLASDLLKQKVTEKQQQNNNIRLITPQPKPGQVYKYTDTSQNFYVKTFNKLAIPQAILTDAQQQLVHGSKYYVLEKENADSTKPSKYEMELRKSAHMRTDLLNAPFHERIMSAPNVRRQVDQQLDKMKQFQEDGVYIKLDEQVVLQSKQLIQQIEIDKDVTKQTRAYTDGRSKARAIQQQLYMQKFVGADGTKHMNDVNSQVKQRYFGGYARQLPLVHDIDDDHCVDDKYDEQLNDVLLDRDEDFTGLGVGSLNEAVLKAQMQHDIKKENLSESEYEEYSESENEDDEEDSDAKKKQQQVVVKKSGYLYRKAIGDIVRSKISAPQYDTPIEPLHFEQKKEERGGYGDNSKAKQEKYLQDILGGGKDKLDPKVNQVVEVANNIFANEDLGINSSSNEDNDIRDSEPSEELQDAKTADQLVFMKKRSDNLEQFKKQLENLNAISHDPTKLQTISTTLPKSKNLITKKEKEAFDLAEAQRIKAWKKKQQEKQQSGGSDQKPKEPKGKKFVSQAEKRMCKTDGGLPFQMQQNLNQQKKYDQALLQQQKQAQQIIQQIPDIEKADKERENEFIQNYKEDQRQTIIYDALIAANITANREQTSNQMQIKNIIGKTLLNPKINPETKKVEPIYKNLNDEQLKAVESMGKEKDQFMQGADQYQMPYIYDKSLTQIIQENMKGTVKEVTQINENQVLLSNKQYLPIQPNAYTANSTRPDFVNNNRINAQLITRQTDDTQSVNDIQQIYNKINQKYQINTKANNYKIDVQQYINQSTKEQKDREQQQFMAQLNSQQMQQSNQSLNASQRKMKQNQQLIDDLISTENKQLIDQDMIPNRNIFNNKITDVITDDLIQNGNMMRPEYVKQQLYDISNNLVNVLATKDQLTIQQVELKDQQMQILGGEVPEEANDDLNTYQRNMDSAQILANCKLYSQNPYQRIVEKKKKKGKGKKKAKKATK